MAKPSDREVLYEIHKLRFDRDDDYVDAVLAALNRLKYHVYPDSWVDVKKPKSGYESLLKKIDVYTPSAVFTNYSVAERRARLYYRAWTQCNMALAAFSLTEERRSPDVWLDVGQFKSTFNFDSKVEGVDATLDLLWKLFARPEAIRKYGLVSAYPGVAHAIEWNFNRMKNAIKIALKASPKDERLSETAETFHNLINNTTLDHWYEEVCGVKCPVPDVPLEPPGVPGSAPDKVRIFIDVIPYAGEGTVELTPSASWYLQAHAFLPAPLGPVKGKAPAPKPEWMQGTAFHNAYLDFTKKLNRIAMKLWRSYVETKIPNINDSKPVADTDWKKAINKASIITGFGTSFPFCGTFAAQLPENLYIHLAAYLLDVPIPGGVRWPVMNWIEAHGIPTMSKVREWYLLYNKYRELYYSTSDDSLRDQYRRAYKCFLGKYRQGMKKIILAKKKLAEGLNKMIHAYREWKRLLEELRLRAYSAIMMVVFYLERFITNVKRRVQRWAAWRRFCLVTCYNIGVKRLLRAKNLVDRSLALRKAYEHIVRRKHEVMLTPKVNAEKTFPKNTREDFYKRFVNILFKATLSTHFLKFEDDPNNFERWWFDIVIGGIYPLRKPKLDLSRWPPKGLRPVDLAQSLKECGRGLKPLKLTDWGKLWGESNWSGGGLSNLLNNCLNRMVSDWEKDLWARVRRERAKIKVSWRANPLRELNVPQLQGEYLVRKYRG